MLLPLNWIVYPIGNLNVIYGVSIEQMGYTFYATDFKLVWSETLDRSQLIERAQLLGVEDVQTKQLKQIISLIEKNVENTSFDIPSLSAALDSKELKWTFNLRKMNPSECILFLASLNDLQFTNHQVLLAKIHNLERIIEIKDVYTKFLTENFKLSHGMDLITAYKRNNKDDLYAIEPFDETKWREQFDTSFPKDIKSATNDVDTWEIARKICLKPVSIKEDTGPFQSVQFYTSPIKKNPPKEETTLIDLKPPKPKFGALKSTRKKPRDEDLNDDDAAEKSPKKRKKFGSLPVRKRK